MKVKLQVCHFSNGKFVRSTCDELITVDSTTWRMLPSDKLVYRVDWVRPVRVSSNGRVKYL